MSFEIELSEENLFQPNEPETETSEHKEEANEHLSEESFTPQAGIIRNLEQLNSFLKENFEQFQRVVASHCYLTPGAADDVVQEMYLRLNRSLERQLDGIHQPWAFVHTLARRLAVDAYRKSLTRSRRFVPLYDDTFRASADEIESDDGNETQSIIREALEELVERQRSVIVKLFLDGMTGRAVSKELGLSESYVAELKTNALHLLRQRLESLESVLQEK